MNADRIEWYKNQLRGIPVADIPLKVRSILMDATNEARREERERVIDKCVELGAIEHDGVFAEEIRATE